MIESGGTAPYAPAPAVIAVLRAYRDRPVQTPIDTAVIARIGVADSIAPRTLQSLKLLDLLDEDGNPTTALQDLRKAASEDEYRARLAEIVRAEYAEIFTYRDPATEDPAALEGAFRAFEPHGMRPRMLRLFLGLCAEAGIIENDGMPRITRTRATTSRPPATSSGTSVRGSRRNEQSPPPAPLPPSPTAGAEHLLIKGLIAELPPVGSEWSDAERRMWTEAALGNFNLMYIRPQSDSEPRVNITPSGKEG
jgi:hypothetical protein